MSDQGSHDGRVEREFPGLAAFMQQRAALSDDDAEPARPSSWARRALVALLALVGGLAAGGVVFGAGWLLVRLDASLSTDEGPYPKSGAVEAVTTAVDRALGGVETVDASAVRGAVEEAARRFAVRHVDARRELDGREVRVMAEVAGDGADHVCVQVVARIGAPALEVGWAGYDEECTSMPQAGHGYISDQMIERRNADGQAALVAALSRYEDTSHAPHDVVALRATLADLGPLLNSVTYEVRGGEVGVVGFVSGSYHCVMGWLGPGGQRPDLARLQDPRGQVPAGRGLRCGAHRNGPMREQRDQGGAAVRPESQHRVTVTVRGDDLVDVLDAVCLLEGCDAGELATQALVERLLRAQAEDPEVQELVRARRRRRRRRWLHLVERVPG